VETRTDLDAKSVALHVGRAVLEAEHRHFVAASVDNGEHIPRILRIAGAIFGVLRRAGLTEKDATSVREALELHGKDLFMAEWHAQIMEGEDPQQVADEGAAEYDRISYAARREIADV
jgi:hypothetical protein